MGVDLWDYVISLYYDFFSPFPESSAPTIYRRFAPAISIIFSPAAMDLLESSSILTTSQACLRLFKEYKANTESTSTSQKNSPADANVSTFLLWARSIGALVHDSANADRCLKDFPDVKRTIIDLLIALQISLQHRTVSQLWFFPYKR